MYPVTVKNDISDNFQIYKDGISIVDTSSVGII